MRFLRLRTSWIFISAFALSVLAGVSAPAAVRCEALFTSMSWTDSAAVRALVSKVQIQEAAWTARAGGDPIAAERIEQKLTEAMTREDVRANDNPYDFNQTLTPLGIGVTETYKLVLDSGLTVIFKPIPEDWKYTDAHGARAANIYAEVDAYKVDRALNLNVVPVTIERDVRDMHGSMQVWVQADASTPSAESMARLKLLDYLINNRDRHSENHLAYANRAVAIDHGLSFVPSLISEGNVPAPRLEELVLLPSMRDVYERLQTHLTPPVIQKMLQGRHSAKAVAEVLDRREKLLRRMYEAYR